MSGFEIRTCTPEDSAIVAATVRASFRDVARRFALTVQNAPRHPSNCTEDWIRQEMASGVTYFVIADKNAVGGCVAMERADAEMCYLERLGVLPEQRHLGLGKALVGHVLSQARRLGAQRVNIGIIAEDRELKGWYKAMGFVEGESRQFAHLPFRVTFMSCEVN